MIIASNLKKSYQKLEVLKGINLSIEKSEVVAIVGPSGAGKSTLLHILGSLDRPDEGTILFNNQDITKMSKAELSHFRNKKIGFVFQFHHLLPEFSALENVAMPGFISGKNEKEVMQSAETLLVIMGLKDRLDHKPSELSGGEQQRTAVARALINKPDLVLADEPSGNLDSQNAQELHRLFLELNNTFKQTFVIVTHNEHLADLCNRKIKMEDGRISVS